MLTLWGVTWVTWNGGGAWQRIFDFGTSDGGEGNSGTGQKYLFLTPSSGAGTLRFMPGIRSSPADNDPVIGATRNDRAGESLRIIRGEIR